MGILVKKLNSLFYANTFTDNVINSSKSSSKKDFNKLIQRKLLLTFLAVLFTISTINAQCSVVGLNDAGTAVSVEIPCDFPILINTGDPDADNQTYIDYKSSWINLHQSIYDAIQAIDVQYYEIHTTDFNLMSEGRKSAILASPEIYRLVD